MMLLLLSHRCGVNVPAGAADDYHDGADAGCSQIVSITDTDAVDRCDLTFFLDTCILVQQIPSQIMKYNMDLMIGNNSLP